MREGFRCGIVTIKIFIRRDPYIPCMILEQIEYEVSAKRIGIRRIMPEHPRAIPIVSPQPILGAEPEKSLIVLHNGADSCVGRPAAKGYVGEEQVRTLENWKPGLCLPARSV